MSDRKMIVVSDTKGNIIAGTIPDEQVETEAKIDLVPLVGQKLQEMAMPDELLKHIGKGSFPGELFRYRISEGGKLTKSGKAD